jgi:hypothetical protein
MTTRRSLLRGALAVAGGVVVNASGWLPERTAAHATSDEYEIFGRFALLKPGQARAPATHTGPALAIIPETTRSGRPPTVHSQDLLQLAEGERAKGPVAGVTVDSSRLRLRDGRRLVHTETGHVVSETLVYDQLPTDDPLVLTAVRHVPVPYSVPAPGSAEFGYRKWIPLADLAPQAIALPSGFAATALWLQEDTLFRLEVFQGSPVAADDTENLIRSARSAIRST